MLFGSYIHAIVTLRSAGKNENRVCVCGTGTSTDINGKTESTEVSETWRFNSKGKADLMYEFTAKTPPEQ